MEITQGLNPNYTRRDLDSVIFSCLFRIYFWLQNPRLVFLLKLRSSTLAGKNLFTNKQECIPVGCVPSAAVAVSGGRGVCPGGRCLQRGCIPPRPRDRHPLPKTQRQTPPGPRGRHTSLDTEADTPHGQNS